MSALSQWAELGVAGMPGRGVEAGLGQHDDQLGHRLARQRHQHVRALVLDAAHGRRQRMGRAGRRGAAEAGLVGAHRRLAARRERHDVVAADEAGDEFGARRVEQLVRAALLLDPALVHHHHQVGQRHRLLLGMGDVDEGHRQLGLPLLELGPHPDAQERIERRQRLVEQQHLGLGDQRPGQRHALLLPAGELAGPAVRERAERHPVEQLAGARVALGLGDAAHLQAEGDVVERVEMGKQRVALEHHRRAALGRGQAGDVPAAEDDVALVDALVAGDHAQRAGLAAAGRPEQAAVAAGGDLQVDAIDRRRVAVVLDRVDEFEVGAAHLGAAGQQHPCQDRPAASPSASAGAAARRRDGACRRELRRGAHRHEARRTNSGDGSSEP